MTSDKEGASFADLYLFSNDHARRQLGQRRLDLYRRPEWLYKVVLCMTPLQTLWLFAVLPSEYTEIEFMTLEQQLDFFKFSHLLRYDLFILFSL